MCPDEPPPKAIFLSKSVHKGLTFLVVQDLEDIIGRSNSGGGDGRAHA